MRLNCNIERYENGYTITLYENYENEDHPSYKGSVKRFVAKDIKELCQILTDNLKGGKK
jgi:hypothetical protein